MTNAIDIITTLTYARKHRTIVQICSGIIGISNEKTWDFTRLKK